MLIQFGAFTLDGDRRQLFRDGAPLHVTPKAFELLTLLATHAPRVVNKEELHRRLWPGTFISDATLSGLIKELRRVLDDRSPAAPIIRTAHRVGYAFCSPIEPVTDVDAAPRHWLVLRRRRVPLRAGENVIGRDITSDVQLDDVSVSRRHARVVIEAGIVRLEDLNSKNGTTVAGDPISGPVTLHGDERLEFGSVAAVYRCADSGMSTETRSRSNLDASAGRSGGRFA
jgi:DNA-binding winged helix-turn-helix (wHTH) protein